MRLNKELLCTALFGVKICMYSSLKRADEEGTVPIKEKNVSGQRTMAGDSGESQE